MNKFIVNVIIKFIVVLICGTIAFLCVYHDYSLYSKPIGKITMVKTSGEKQQIRTEIKNGEKKGQFRDIELKYDKALVYDQKYHKGDVVFLESFFCWVCCLDSEVERVFLPRCALWRIS